jgi:uncharacterized protein YyaL (SSP411 family)
MNVNSQMIDLFWDKKSGGLFFTGEGNEQLITQSKELYDGALPSGNSVAVLNFLRLHRLTGKANLETKAEKLIQAFSKPVNEQPMAYTQFLGALDFVAGPIQEIVVVGDTASKETQAMLQVVRHRFLPNTVLLVKEPGPQGDKLAAMAPFVGAMKAVKGQSTAYVCENYVCRQPTVDVGELESLLQ